LSVPEKSVRFPPSILPFFSPGKIRLAGIDAPESSQAFGNRAKQALAEKVGGKTIEVVQQSKDRYLHARADRA